MGDTRTQASTLRLGETEVTRIGLGTNRLTREHVEFVKEAVAAGIQLVDTAHVYTDGESERAIGEALSPLPEGCVVATKGGYAEGDARPDVLTAQIEESLRRLRTNAIELYYLHRVDARTPVEESMGAIKEYVDRGAIRHVGISAVGVELIDRARQVVPIAAVQNHYNLGERKYEEVVDYCAREGIAFVPYYPLRGDGPSELDEIAERHRATPQQIALAWLLRRAAIVAPIPGTLSLEHLRQNLGSLDIELSDEEFEALS